MADDAMLKAQRDAVAALAKRIADSARADAEMKAGIEKFSADLRKRGRAQ